MAEPPTVCAERSSADAIRQGEVLSGVREFLPAASWVDGGCAGNLEITAVDHAWVVVLTQDCDLEQDFKKRRGGSSGGALVSHVLLCGASPASEFSTDLRAQGKAAFGRLPKIVGNQEPKYQYLQKTPAERDLQDVGVPALVLDFQRAFSIPTDVLYAQLRTFAKRRTIMNSPYHEQVTTRFASNFARIGLPHQHDASEYT